jgi:hypothetical protein
MRAFDAMVCEQRCPECGGAVVALNEKHARCAKEHRWNHGVRQPLGCKVPYRDDRKPEGAE